MVNVTDALPPISPGVYILPAPTINRSRKSGVPFDPSHICQPVGMLAAVLFHIQITPLGTTLCTKDVVAIAVLFVVGNCAVAVELVNVELVKLTLVPTVFEILPPVICTLLETKLVNVALVADKFKMPVTLPLVACTFDVVIVVILPVVAEILVNPLNDPPLTVIVLAVRPVNVPDVADTLVIPVKLPPVANILPDDKFVNVPFVDPTFPIPEKLPPVK